MLGPETSLAFPASPEVIALFSKHLSGPRGTQHPQREGVGHLRHWGLPLTEAAEETSQGCLKLCSVTSTTMDTVMDQGLHGAKPTCPVLGVFLEMATESLEDTDRGAKGVRPPGLLFSLFSLHQGCRNRMGRDPHARGHLVEGVERRPCLCPSSFRKRGRVAGRTEQGRWLQCRLIWGKPEAVPEVTLECQLRSGCVGETHV